MLFLRPSKSNRKHPASSTAVAFLLVTAGFFGESGIQRVNGLVIGETPGVVVGKPEIPAEGGWVAVKGLKNLITFGSKRLGTAKGEKGERRRWAAGDETLGVIDIGQAKPDSNPLAKRYAPVYDPTLGLCVCDGQRSFNTPALPESEKMAYCVQICGPPLVGVSATTSSTPTSTVQTSTSAPPPAETTPPATSITIITSVTVITSTPPPVTPTQTNNVVDTSSGAQGNGNNHNVTSGRDDNTGLKIGVGVAVGVIVSLLIGIGIWLFLRRRKAAKNSKENEMNFGCIGAGAGSGGSNTSLAHRTGEKYIYSAGTPQNHSASTMNGASNPSPPSPRSIPPAYSGPAGSNAPSSTNSSSTSINTNPPILPLGAPSRAIDVNGNGSGPRFIPGNLNSSNSSNKHQHKTSSGSTTPVRGSGAVQPPSITFFLHPVQNDKQLEEDERQWLNDEQKRIREKKEAVEELNKLREEEDKIREKIRERMQKR